MPLYPGPAPSLQQPLNRAVLLAARETTDDLCLHEPFAQADEALLVPRYRAEIANDYALVADRWEALAQTGGSTAFQRRAWLSTWYETHRMCDGFTPVLVTITSADGRHDIAAFPLVLRTTPWMRLIEPADARVTDYNGPIVSRRTPTTKIDARELMLALCSVLPRADLLLMRKMPTELGGYLNPAVLAGSVLPCDVRGRPLHLTESIEAWMKTRSAKNREQSRRRWRTFLEHPGARYVRATTADDVQRHFSALVRLQAARVDKFDGPYVLGEKLPMAFYEQLAARAIHDPNVVLTALECADEIVAVMMGVRQDGFFGIPRLTMAGGHWSKLSPGVLLAEATINDLYAEGVRCFDFTIGDYEYKRRLRLGVLPLFDICLPLSLKGRVIGPVMTARQRLKRHPKLVAFVQKLRGTQNA